jgi:ATP-dependent DNA helicase DinG
MSYGRRLVRGLPPMCRLSDHQAFMDALVDLTKDATSSWTS